MGKDNAFGTTNFTFSGTTYVVSGIINTTNNPNKQFIRIAPIGEFNKSMYQWSFDYKARGYNPREIVAGRIPKEPVPMDAVIEGFRIIYEGARVEEAPAPSSVVTTNNSVANTATVTTNTTTNTVSRNDVLLAIVNNCGGDKDILNRVLDMLSSNEGTNVSSSTPVATSVNTPIPSNNTTVDTNTDVDDSNNTNTDTPNNTNTDTPNNEKLGTNLDGKSYFDLKASRVKPVNKTTEEKKSEEKKSEETNSSSSSRRARTGYLEPRD